MFARIRDDARHHALTVLSDRRVEQHEFGSWNMALRRVGDARDVYDMLVMRSLAGASDPVRAQFVSLIPTGQSMPT